MKVGPARSTRLNRAALGEMLELSGLFDRELAVRVADLGGRFPAITERNMFLEYELREAPTPAGFGLGFLPGLLDHYRSRNHWFPNSPTGCAIEVALSDDPFASDHAVYLNLLSDSDPDWIEYDIENRQINPTPFVFFRFPSRYRTICTRKQARNLCETLPEGMASGEFSRMLGALVDLAPACMYRVGVARQRGRTRWRAIITGLREVQVSTALRDQRATDFSKPLEFARMFYAGRVDAPGACFALSIDIDTNRILAMDVECPYLFRIKDFSVRNLAFKELLAQLGEAGSISAQMENWLGEHCCMDLVSKNSLRQLRVMLHHLKFRFLGSPHLRIKAYFHLDMTNYCAKDAVS
jgi:hypothetical protein